MANEISLHFLVPGRPDSALASWRAQPPSWINQYGYKQIDESFNSLVFERRHTSKLAKAFGLDAFSFGMWESVQRLTALFVDDGSGHTRITINGYADPKARGEIEAYAQANALK